MHLGKNFGINLSIINKKLYKNMFIISPRKRQKLYILEQNS